MYKTILISALSIFILVSCKGEAPKMERDITVWNGVPETGSICHEDKNKQPICLDTRDPKFQTFGCSPFDDEAVILKYIAALNDRCEKWKPEPQNANPTTQNP